MNPQKYKYALVGNGKIFKGGLQDALHHSKVLAHEITSKNFHHTLIAYAPPVPLLGPVAESLKEHPESAVVLASQAISWKRHGMDTGGVPADSLNDLGVRVVIINHSEQKAYLKYAPEYHRLVSLQIANAVDCNLGVVLCCGEEKGDHGGRRGEQLYGDLHEVLRDLGDLQRAGLPRRLVIAYEPGGVIGTGKTAPIKQIRHAFAEINEILEDFGLAHGIRLLYGGGVNISNLEELHHGLESENDLFGYLVGEASVRAEEFVEMGRKLERRAETFIKTATVPPAPMSAVPEAPTESMTGAQSIVRTELLRPTRVAIVGFGEIGAATAIACAQDPDHAVDVVQVFNRHLSPEDAWARVAYSRYVDPTDASFWMEDGRGYLQILDQLTEVTPHDSMEDAARRLKDIDVVVFTIGEYTKDPAFFKPFLQDGRAKVVLVTCASAAADYTMVPGFNHHLVNLRQHKIIALGSCTGNCAIPILAVIEDQFGAGAIRGIYAVAPHSKTNSQEIGTKGVDPKKEALLGNLIPTSTGLSKLVQQPGFFRIMSDSIEAISVRTPTEDASLLCMAVDVEGADKASTADIRAAFRSASKSARWRGIIGIDQARGTKVFWRDRRASVIFDNYTRLLPKFLKSGQRSPLSTLTVMAAYANVFGFSWQVVRAVKALKLGRVGVERERACLEEPALA